MASFSATFSNVLLMLLYLLPGFLLCKCQKVKLEHLGSISVILLYVCGPCLFLNALTSLEPSAELTGKMGLFLLFSLFAEVALMLLLRLAMGRRKKEFGPGIFTVASVMGNVGFFGLPLVRAVFPGAPEAAAYSCVFTASLNILGWTVGVYALTGEKKHISFRAAFLNPTVVSVAAGVVLYLLRAGSWLPVIIRDGFRVVASMSTPLCMFILGIRLATLRLKSLFTSPLVYAVAAGKLVLFPLFCALVVLPFPLDPVFKACMLILGATPCASILFNFAEMHRNGQALTADCVLLTTLLSLVTVPLMSLLA